MFPSFSLLVAMHEPRSTLSRFLDILKRLGFASTSFASGIYKETPFYVKEKHTVPKVFLVRPAAADA